MRGKHGKDLIEGSLWFRNDTWIPQKFFAGLGVLNTIELRGEHFEQLPERKDKVLAKILSTMIHTISWNRSQV